MTVKAMVPLVSFTRRLCHIIEGCNEVVVSMCSYWLTRTGSEHSGSQLNLIRPRLEWCAVCLGFYFIIEKRSFSYTIPVQSTLLCKESTNYRSYHTLLSPMISVPYDITCIPITNESFTKLIRNIKITHVEGDRWHNYVEESRSFVVL